MVESNIIIINKLGLHARAAAKLVATAGAFGASVQVGVGDKSVDGKSIMAVMMLAASKGTELTVRCDGEDEQAALTAVLDIISQRFGEAE
ncbi:MULTISPECIES: HPr family phosphocarrier protein [Zhongshania]|jgi:phosphocarrier protein|uniref:HPr family phosphocarrier protein n=1 Tax=Zhongshania marina TaxID=2304603 RepID=A0ABX9W224_9GAMM|nr:HPr family phosphocarrier protein [Zhongshania aliphaticivorans]RNL61607.1 HPr family phosphocarrier protein [Zhongshania marina]CAA0095905.1 Phosphocarrier protein HPr [Zhongshania aliphaticivorans]